VAGPSRNPYVILGIPFGASGDMATAAFARRSRGLRRAPDGTARLTELTWALNQVQEALVRPEAAFDLFRVPADPGALVPDGPGALGPPPEPLGRRSGPSDEARERLLAYARHEALTALRHEVAAARRLPER
jgi:hypothetical protein